MAHVLQSQYSGHVFLFGLLLLLLLQLHVSTKLLNCSQVNKFRFYPALNVLGSGSVMTLRTTFFIITPYIS
jgi:hypothetical protein